MRGPATILEAPEGGSRLALIDVQGADAEAAVAAAWAAYPPQTRWPLKVTNDLPDKDGWSRRRQMSYQTSPNERRDVAALAQHANGQWTVVIYDMAQDVGEKRGAQVGLVFDRLLPKGYTRETFAGKTAHPLDAARIAALGAFVEAARKATGVPGVSIGLVQDGKIVFAGGFGVRELGNADASRRRHLYMIASNTKALTTLLLARLVDQRKLTLGHAGDDSCCRRSSSATPTTTRQVLVKHLICACTGLPRQDFEWLFEFKDLTPERAVADARHRCSRPASSARCSSTRTRSPAPPASSAGTCCIPISSSARRTTARCRSRSSTPLGMTSTTFDYARALAGNHAAAHAPDVDGKPARRGDGGQLLDHPGAARRRRVEQRQRHAQVRADGARAGRAARRRALHRARRRCSSGACRRCRSARTPPTAWACRSTPRTACRSSITAAT